MELKDFRQLTERYEQTGRMPALFIGHGSPMNAIEANAFSRAWRSLGPALPKPAAILCVSAHWETRGTQVTAMARPRTIHDFGGFPRELYEVQYPALGDAALAQEVTQMLRLSPAALDQRWGLDHGCWSVVMPMFPAADVPVLQLSLDVGKTGQAHYETGRALAALRKKGVLIVGSGNIVHNLRAMQWGAGPDKAYDWAKEFDDKVASQIASGNLGELPKFQSMGQTATLAHPTYDHYLPLLYTAGAAVTSDKPRFFNADFQGASIAMRSVVWS